MSPRTLIASEIRYRFVSFLLTVGCVSVAIAAWVAAMTFLRADRMKTDELLADREQQVQAAAADLEDSMRKITKGLGFNILVLPEDQDIGQLHADGVPSATMPQTFVDKLANSKIVTINHLLPIVARKVSWPERRRDVILTGTQGEVPLLHRALKKPLQDAVPAGTMLIGSEVAASTAADVPALTEGSRVSLMGREFVVTRVHEPRGTSDDITVWINLQEAQEMLGLQNVVHAILALECNCATQDRLAEIRDDLAEILPGTQVLERGPPALARAEARNKAKHAAEQSLAAEESSRQAIRTQRTRLAAILVPLIVTIAATWIALLTILNVRQRRDEIGILRTIGLGSRTILLVLLGKSVVAGLAGGLLGLAIGFTLGLTTGDLAGSAHAATKLWSPGLVLMTALAAPGLSLLAGWLPALLAARTDPATVLAGS